VRRVLQEVLDEREVNHLFVRNVIALFRSSYRFFTVKHKELVFHQDSYVV